VAVAVAVAVAVGVGVNVAVGVGVNVAVAVAVAVGVGDRGGGVGVAVAVAVGVGLGVVTTTMYLESLGMPLVKTVTRAGPGGKLFTGVEVKVMSDQPAIGSTRRNETWLLSMSRSWTTG
jgi:hypothetical protein